MAFGFFDDSNRHQMLPHPPISVAVHLIVEEAIRVAWRRLRTQPREGFNLHSAVEDVVTHELYEVLFDDVFDKGIVSGFDRQTFVTGNREAKLRSYDGSHLDKMPDMTIELIGAVGIYKPTQNRLFIECKPIDSNHTVGQHYCDKGILRFVCGEYAWTMTSALMVGYVSGDYTIVPKLSVAIVARKGSLPVSSEPKVCPRTVSTPFSEPVQITSHGRTFQYVETSEQAPDVTLRHLWLQRN